MLEDIAATPIGEISLRKPARATADTTLLDVVTHMRERRRGGTIIEDENGHIIGIFTEYDLMLRVNHQNQDWHKTAVKDVMTEKPVRVLAEESLATAMRRMKQGSFRHLPVVNEDGSTVGIVSIRDILNHIVEHFPEVFINLPPDPDHEARRRWGG
ncbi:MAG: CBS domain-containing protein [Proteobacteria bacterium]|nr:CBS domain-containing protein [Pseudomonadota bacterium]